MSLFVNTEITINLSLKNNKCTIYCDVYFSVTLTYEEMAHSDNPLL